MSLSLQNFFLKFIICYGLHKSASSLQAWGENTNKHLDVCTIPVFKEVPDLNVSGLVSAKQGNCFGCGAWPCSMG